MVNYRIDRFVIQLGHPKISQGSFTAFEQVRDAFVHLFRAKEESSYLFWHQIPLRFRYHEDLYQSFDNILAMVWLIQRDDQGTTIVNFSTQLLSMHWRIQWRNGWLVIRGAYTAQENLYTPYAESLNQNPEIKMSKQAFLSEWKTLLHQIVISFQEGGVVIQEGTERRKWEMLQRVEKQIPEYGQLYLRST